MDQNSEPRKIVFEGEEFQRPAQSFQTSTPKIIRWVMTYSGGLIKNDNQANYVLIVFMAVSIIVSLFLIFSGSGPSKPPAGFRGNIPNTPEYQSPPRPEDLR